MHYLLTGTVLDKTFTFAKASKFKEKKGKKARKCWVPDIFKSHNSYGVFTTLSQKLKSDREFKKNIDFLQLPKYGLKDFGRPCTMCCSFWIKNNTERAWAAQISHIHV